MLQRILTITILFAGLIACHRSAQSPGNHDQDTSARTTGDSAATAPAPISGNASTSSATSANSATLDRDTTATSGSGDARSQPPSANDNAVNVTKKKASQGAGAYPSVGTFAEPSAPVPGDKTAPGDIHKGEK